MRKTIYKYPLEIVDEQVVLLPTGAKILTVQAQMDKPCIWAMINPTAPDNMAVTIRMIGTGQPIQDDYCLEYIGTFQIYGGRLVFHAFEKL